MKYLKSNIRFLVLLSVFGLVAGNIHAQPNTMYYMKNISQTWEMNPANTGIESGWHFSMPGFSGADLKMNTNGWKYSDLIHQGTGQYADSLIVDLDKFYNKLDDSNIMFEKTNYSFFTLGFRTGRHVFNVAVTEKEFANTFFGNNLVALVKNGNAPYLGSSFNTGTFGLNGIHYRELALGYAYDLNKKVTLGMTAKILFGMGAAQSKDINMSVQAPGDASYVNVEGAGQLNVSGPFSFYTSPDGLVDSVDTHFDGSYLTNAGNMGMAIDLGAVFKPSEDVTLSASIIDLGSISWKTDVTNLALNGQFNYQGVNIDNSLNKNDPNYKSPGDAFSDLGDSIKHAFSIDNTNNKFHTAIPVKVYIGGSYQVNPNIEVGGLARARIYNSQASLSLTASGNAYWGNFFNVSASYSIIEGSYANLGLGFGLRGGPVQFYMVTDNVLTAVNPADASSLNLGFGLNFLIGYNKEKHRGPI
ncbi:DUF5723 family protein [Prolixibacter sp. SD074]|jgi:hypothetical protein|uniref:DUF5723 family protein n=1 Tax=Prolixibacter sp. SD074 TaxID=2652391 RepID=UPI00127D4705|nr:DUF5723 family protein [Prolixibacter sp. SD074]GET30599.1 hypothetical protein SD074_28010 [Prolixibacter sp. SD074]